MCDVNIRLLEDKAEDYKLLEKWYQEEEIYSSFEQRKLNYKEIKEKYYPELKVGINTEGDGITLWRSAPQILPEDSRYVLVTANV